MQDRFGALRRFGVCLLRTLAVAAIVAGGLTASSATAVAAPDSWIVVDAKTGKTLHARKADSKRYPASLTKMMTLYLLFEALESGRISLDTRIKVSARAAAQPPSKLGLKAGQTIRVRDAILSQVTKSANDISVAIAERLAGSERNFARQMTNKARALGMTATTFRNASGLPDSGQATTARDMATLGRALRQHYPQYFSYFKAPSFVWNGRRISNHNRLLGRVAGVDGIKTGYTRASGFNLVTSVKRGDREIVGVVIGGETSKWRDQKMAGLIKKYLPRASTGVTVAVIPGGPGAGHGRGEMVAINDYPVPRLRPQDDAAFASASLASVVGANSIYALETRNPQGDAAVGDEAQASEAPDMVAGGWHIQLAATPSRSSAEGVLDRALAKGSTVLADASPYTEPVVKRGTTLYRARFAGFPDKIAARAACAYLVKRDFDCLALSN